MSQNTTSSVRDLLPDNCFLNLEDDDNDTLDLVTDVNDSYYPSTNIYPVTVQFDDLDIENGSDSDSDSAAFGDETKGGTVYDMREDIQLSEDLSEFFKTGCGCKLVKVGRTSILFLMYFYCVVHMDTTKSTDIFMAYYMGAGIYPAITE